MYWNAISATTELNCGSCRAPARLRRRRYCRHSHRLTLRYRSLAKARELPQGTCCVRWVGLHLWSAMSATIELNCGSCRAPARLRRRRYCWHFHRLTVRYRSLAKARELPQEDLLCQVDWAAPASAISATIELNCGSCRAPARLRRRRYCRHSHRLTLRYRSLAKARELPQEDLLCQVNWAAPANTISATTELNCGSCRAPARLRRRRYCRHFHRLTLRYRSLAKARELPQGTCWVRWIGLHLRAQSQQRSSSTVGAVEPQRGCEGGGTAGISIA